MYNKNRWSKIMFFNKNMFPNEFIYVWPVGQAVKTPPFHGGITGSNPVRVTKYFKEHVKNCIYSYTGGLAQLGEHLPYKQGVAGSSPASSTIIYTISYRGVEQSGSSLGS